MAVKRICGPFGSGNNASVVPVVIQTDEDLALDECGVIVCVDADAIVTLPPNPTAGTEILVVADGGLATVEGGAFPLMGGPATVRVGFACRFVFGCNDVWVAECCCPTATGAATGVPGPTGASGAAAGADVLEWGALGVIDAESLLAPHFLYPGYAPLVASLLRLDYVVPRAGVASHLHVFVNQLTLGVGVGSVTYTVQRNAAPTALSVTVGENSIGEENVADSVAFNEGDLISVEVLVTAPVTAVIGNVFASLRFA